MKKAAFTSLTVNGRMVENESRKAELSMLYDKDIREPLFDFLEEAYGKIRLLEEQPMGRSRADIVMIAPEALCGIEIKSDADTYARLKRQVKDYDRYYDYNIVVVGTSHAAHISEHVPDWWGIITVEPDDKGRADFYILRQADVNPKVIDRRKITILWRTELNRLLAGNQLPGYRQKGKLFVQENLIEKVPGEVLWPQACEELFERDYNTIEQEIREYRKRRK